MAAHSKNDQALPTQNAAPHTISEVNLHHEELTPYAYAAQKELGKQQAQRSEDMTSTPAPEASDSSVQEAKASADTQEATAAAAESEQVSSAEAESETSAAPDADKQSQPRRFVRPRRRHSPSEAMNAALAAQPELNVATEAQQAAIKAFAARSEAKARRGRPRKNPLPEPSSESTAAGSATIKISAASDTASAAASSVPLAVSVGSVNDIKLWRGRGRSRSESPEQSVPETEITLPTMCYSTAFEAELPMPVREKRYKKQAVRTVGSVKAYPWTVIQSSDLIQLAESNPPEGIDTHGFIGRAFTKWVGGKVKLVTRLLELVPDDFETYFEPFVGGGSMYYVLSPRAKCSYICDLNSELMNTYVQLMVNLEEVKKRLRTYVYDKDFYLEVRNRDRDPAFYQSDPIDRAVRLLYLLRVCFNGLYRVNSKNQFNVPFGRYTNPEICRDQVLNASSAHLNHYKTKVFAGQYYALLPYMNEKSFVYFDPPYMPVSDTAYFTDYQVEGFGYKDQVALSEFCRELDRRGIRFMLSNSCCDEVKRLYNGFNIHVLDNVQRVINSTTSLRSGHKELVITNY